MSQSKEMFKSKNGWSLILDKDNEIVVLSRGGSRYTGNRGAIKRTYIIGKAIEDKFHPDDKVNALLNLLLWCRDKAERMGEKDIYGDQ